MVCTFINSQFLSCCTSQPKELKTVLRGLLSQNNNSCTLCVPMFNFNCTPVRRDVCGVTFVVWLWNILGCLYIAFETISLPFWEKKERHSSTQIRVSNINVSSLKFSIAFRVVAYGTDYINIFTNNQQKRIWSSGSYLCSSAKWLWTRLWPSWSFSLSSNP